MKITTMLSTLAVAAALVLGAGTAADAQRVTAKKATPAQLKQVVPLPKLNFVGAPCTAVTTRGLVVRLRIKPNGVWVVSRFVDNPATGYITRPAGPGTAPLEYEIPPNCIFEVDSHQSPTGK